MRAYPLLLVASVAGLAGCSPKGQHEAASAQPAGGVSATVAQCAKGGEAAAHDPACKQASDENFRRFMGKDSSREH